MSTKAKQDRSTTKLLAVADVGGRAMSAASPESDRLKHENAYLIARVIEVETELRDAIHGLVETFSGLQALEKIKLLKAGELAELFQVSQDRVYELVRTRSLPVVSLGAHQVRFDPIAVRRWLDEGGRSALSAIEDAEIKTGLRDVRG